MKRIFIIYIICTLVFAGCSFKANDPDTLLSETEEVALNDYENVLPTPDTIKIYSDGDKYQQEDIARAMELLNSVVISDNTDIIKLESNNDTINWMKENYLGIEILYESPVTINFTKPWENVEKLYLALDGENQKLLFRAESDGYLSGSFSAINDDGLQKLLPYFHVTPPKQVKSKEVIHIWDSIGDYSEEKVLKSDVVIMVSNQSFYKPTVKLIGTINGEKVFSDGYKVKDQHEVVYYYGKLPYGEYTMEIVSDDGASIEETFQVNEGDDTLWMYITYWCSDDDNTKINILKQNEPIYLD